MIHLVGYQEWCYDIKIIYYKNLGKTFAPKVLNLCCDVIKHFKILGIFLQLTLSILCCTQISYIQRNNMKYMPRILYWNSPKALPIRTYLCNVKQIIKTIGLLKYVNIDILCNFV